MKKAELRLTGSGGQGVILGTIILAEAGLFSGKEVVQSQAYGPEARGGMCKAEVVIDEKPITYTKVAVPNFLLALTQASFNKFSPTVTDDSIVMVDSSIQVPEDYKKAHKVIQIPILETATDVIGNPMSANIVAVGAISEALNYELSTVEALEKSVVGRIPKGTEELNLKALHAGMDLVKNL